MPDASSAAGEAGGIIAGSVALLYALGRGAAWLLNWKEARAQSRAAKLQAWHDELAAREAKQDERDVKYQLHIEGELSRQGAQLRRATLEIRVLRTAFELVAEPLRRLEPDNPSLMRANEMLLRAFPLDPALPADLAALTAMIDHIEPSADRI